MLLSMLLLQLQSSTGNCSSSFHIKDCSSRLNDGRRTAIHGNVLYCFLTIFPPEFMPILYREKGGSLVDSLAALSLIHSDTDAVAQ